MRIFKITKDIEVVCVSENTRSGFRHLATLFKDGVEVAKAKACYQNRTWERYEFESVLSHVVDRALLSDKDDKLCRDFIEGDQTDWSNFKATIMVAKLGDLFCNNQKDKNDWKKRMLKAGIQGLDIPNDWNTLGEDEKEKRLNRVIKIMSEKV